MLDCIRGGAKPVNKLLKPCGIVLITGMSTQSLIYVGRKLGMNKKRKSDHIDCKFSKRFLIQWQPEAEKEIEQDYGRHERGVFIIQPHVIFFMACITPLDLGSRKASAWFLFWEDISWADRATNHLGLSRTSQFQHWKSLCPLHTEMVYPL